MDEQYELEKQNKCWNFPTWKRYGGHLVKMSHKQINAQQKRAANT